MTAPRRPRSAWLLVGSTPSTSTNVQSAGRELEQVVADRAGVAVARGFGRVGLEQRAQLTFEWGDPAFECRPVAVLLVDLPGGEELFGDPQPGLAELFLCGHAFGVGGEVAEQVRPAQLPFVGRELVVGP